MNDFYDRNIGVIGPGTPCESVSLEQLGAAAKEFERLLNSFPGLVEATLESIEYGAAGVPIRNKFYLKVRHVQKVF